MAETALLLDRLVGERRIAADWAAALRASDATLDAKLEACPVKVAEAGPYLPVAQDGHPALWRVFERSSSPARPRAS